MSLSDDDDAPFIVDSSSNSSGNSSSSSSSSSSGRKTQRNLRLSHRQPDQRVVVGSQRMISGNFDDFFDIIEKVCSTRPDQHTQLVETSMRRMLSTR